MVNIAWVHPNFLTFTLTSTVVFLLQRFFKYLCIASKVNSVVGIAKEAISDGKVSFLNCLNQNI